MKILSVNQYKDTTFEVILDNGKKFFLHIDIITDYGLSTGKELDEAMLRRIIYASNFRRAYQYALYCFDRRDYSAEEIFSKLKEKYKNEKLCLEVVKKLSRVGILDDERYAERLARKYIEVRKFGFYRARREMIMKGLEENIVKNALMPYEQTITDNLEQLIKKKYSRFLIDEDDFKSVNKVKNSLVRFGYGFDEINQAINNYFENEETSYEY